MTKKELMKAIKIRNNIIIIEGIDLSRMSIHIKEHIGRDLFARNINGDNIQGYIGGDNEQGKVEGDNSQRDIGGNNHQWCVAGNNVQGVVGGRNYQRPADYVPPKHIQELFDAVDKSFGDK